MRKVLLILLLMVVLPSGAQEDFDDFAVISGENYLQLHSSVQINYSDGFYVASANPDSQEIRHDIPFDTGWFVYNDVVNRFIALDAEKNIQVFNLQQINTFQFDGSNLVDAVPFDDGFAFVFAGEGQYRVIYDNLLLYGGRGQEMTIISDDEPQAIWGTCPSDSPCFANLEVRSGENSEIVRLPDFTAIDGGNTYLEFDGTDFERIPYAPAQDPEAVVRIGRIEPPYAVTSSIEGIVKLWNIQTAEALYEVDNGTGQASVFGAINHAATHLVWRDNENQALYLLNFETGENRLIDNLNGDYAQWYFLSNDAKVILAVNLGFEPNIVAWDSETGERTVLGEYRHCERPQPDMARLSQDGTALIIGCDTGLDIWRITEN